MLSLDSGSVDLNDIDDNIDVRSNHSIGHMNGEVKDTNDNEDNDDEDDTDEDEEEKDL
jgi:hypothetical protein